MIDIPKGLYEVLNSCRLSVEQKQESVRHFARPVHHLDGEPAGFIEPAVLAEEDAELICEALSQDGVIDLVGYSPGGEHG